MNKISKKISFGLILVLVVFTSIYGVTNTKSIAPPSNGYTITCYGYVKDYNTNTGIYGVSVVLRDTLYGITKTVTTSSTGYYSVSITVPSYLRFTLTVSKSGYITQSKSFTRTGSYRSDFLFCKTGTHIVTCTGYVLDGHYGFVLSGAIITLSSPTPGGLTRSVTSSSSGYYSVSLSTTEYLAYELKATKDTYHEGSVEVYSSGSIYQDFPLMQPTAFIDINAPDMFPANWFLGNNIQTNVKLFDTYAIAEIRIRFNVGSGYISTTATAWHELESHAILINEDGSTETPGVVFGHFYNNYLTYGTDIGIDLETSRKIVELYYKIQILQDLTNPQFDITFIAQTRTWCNTDMYYHPVAMFGDAYVEPVDEIENLLSLELLAAEWGVELSELYTEEYMDYLHVDAEFLGIYYDTATVLNIINNLQSFYMHCVLHLATENIATFRFHFT